MNPHLAYLLKDVGISGNIGYSYLTVCGSTNKWNIKADKIGDFWKKYCEIVEEDEELSADGESSNGCLFLAEKCQSIMPIIADCTFKFQLSEENKDAEFYNMRFLLFLIFCFQAAIRESTEDIDEEILYCCVLESDSNVVVEDSHGH